MLQFILNRFGEDWMENFFEVNEYFRSKPKQVLVSTVTNKEIIGRLQFLPYKPMFLEFLWEEAGTRVTLTDYYFYKYDYIVKDNNIYVAYVIEDSQKFYPVEMLKLVGPAEEKEN